MKHNFYVTKKVSKNQKEYTALFVDLGYKQEALSFDLVTIMKLTDMNPREIAELNIGEIIEV